jgi:adenine-specific DNA-methyltransferase
MPITQRFEKQFFNALQDIFVGAKVEGDSGYVNLMHIKSRYYEQGVFPQLQKDITAALQPFPDFREELFDKLFTFFQRYFSESGSIYFRYTALHQNVYEKVYTDDRDVILFWKTHMLYYVKTDRIFTSLNVEVDGVKFFFDASKMTLKKSNEKREVIYAFRKVQPEDGTLVFDVSYSEKGKTTRVDDILKDIKKASGKLDDETLNKAFRVFEKQSEVDFFINKDARAFLQEQFDLWLYQYLFTGQNVWSTERLAQLQVLKAIAYKVIDFISQFEDELVKIWNKPKFVRNSHYVLTLDKLTGSPVMEKLMAHPNLPQQVQEWRDLGMISADFKLEMLTQKDLTGALLHKQYLYLPIDTKHFADLELDILALFDDLDTALDGWLVHSENYQALNTTLPKFNGRVRCIHIDPPYNTNTSGFLYKNNFQHSSWLSMMFDRLQLSQSFLDNKGVLACHIDENEYERLWLLLSNMAFNNLGTLSWDKRNAMTGGKGIATQHEYIILSSNSNDVVVNIDSKIFVEILEKAQSLIKANGGKVNNSVRKKYTAWLKTLSERYGGEVPYKYIDDDGSVYQSVSLRAPEKRTDPKFFIPLNHPVTGKPCPVPPNGFSRTPETLQSMIEAGDVLFGEDERVQPRQKARLTPETEKQITSVIQNGNKGKADVDALGIAFPYCHPVSLYESIIGSLMKGQPDAIVLDYFAGSGTSAHAVMNLNRADGRKRKYILVELDEHFNTVILPRIKKVAFSDKWKEGKPNGGKGMSHFVKYYDLEQYEDVLRRAHYADADLFHNPYEDPYHSYVFLRDLKMLDSVEIDEEQNKAHFHPERLYPDPTKPSGTSIDLAETLSQRRGKWIKRITAEYVEFQDGERMSLTDPDWQTIKPLIWWQ